MENSSPVIEGTAGVDANRTQTQMKLPVEVIGRVFEFYYDLVHEDWYDSNRQEGLLAPLLVCRGLLPFAKQALWAHPHLDFEALSVFLDSGGLSLFKDKLREVRHLTVRPGRHIDSVGRDEDAALECRLPELLALTPKLFGLSLLDVPVFKGLDAVVLLECLRVAGDVKKLRLELLMMNLATEAPGHLINAAERSSRPDKTVVGSIRSPTSMGVQPFGLNDQAREFRPRPDELADWWRAVLNEQAIIGHRTDMTVRALTQRPRYVTNGSYPESTPDVSVVGYAPYVPPELEEPDSLQRADGSYDADLITHTEYVAMMALMYSPDVGKRQAAARWLRDRPLYAGPTRPENAEYAGLPLNLLDSGKPLANRLRWRLVDHFQRHAPDAAYFVFRDPAAAGVAHDHAGGFWTALPIPHIRVRLARGMDPDDVFHREDLGDAPPTCTPVRGLELPSRGGTVTLWKTTHTREHRDRQFPVHSLTRRFEMVCNSAKDLEGFPAGMPQKMRLLLGEEDEDWRGVELGKTSMGMSRKERERIEAAYKEDYAAQFGGEDVFVEYGMVDVTGPGGGPWGEWADDDELIGTPPASDSDSDSDGGDDAPGGAGNADIAEGDNGGGDDDDEGGDAAPIAGPPQPLLLPMQQHITQQVQHLLVHHMAQIAHEQAQADAQAQARAHARAHFTAQLAQLDAQLAQLEALEDLTPQQQAANANTHAQIANVQALMAAQPAAQPFSPPPGGGQLLQVAAGLQAHGAQQMQQIAQQGGGGDPALQLAQNQHNAMQQLQAQAAALQQAAQGEGAQQPQAEATAPAEEAGDGGAPATAQQQDQAPAQTDQSPTQPQA